MDKGEIIKAIMEREYQISPEAVELIKSSNSPENLLKYILSTVDDSVIVIGTEHIDLEGFEAHYQTLKLILEDNQETCKNSVHNFIPTQDNTPEPVSVSELIPDIRSIPDIRIDDDSSDEVSDSYLASESLSKTRAVPESVFSPLASQVGNRPAFSFFGRENSAASNRISRTDRSFFNSENGSSSNSRDEGYKNYPGPNPVTVVTDISGHSTCIGEYMQFVQYFRDRYSRLSEIIRSRVNARPMESLKRRNFRYGRDRSPEEISIIGMVSDTSSTTNGHRILTLEDPTGSFSVLIRNADKELFELASKILLDEVIGVTGSVTNDGNLMIASKIVQPDVPNNVTRKTGTYGKVVLISDVHVGSSQFLEDSWLDFLDFLKGKSDSEAMRELAASIRYLVVAGDLVDGIGIYPDQELELDILDVYDQYKKAAEYFREIPEHIRVIISPGNHDAVRQAEPQPALPERIQADFPQNVIFVGNPAFIELDGVRILIYHGRSIDDLVASVPGVTYQEPAGAVLEMVKRRHLAPTYGSRVSISPEKKDYFVIDPLPDIIHTGHVHTMGIQRYKNILLVNSGTWQGQTEFQKRVNLTPVPARIPIVDLADCTYKILTFD
ncbi:MAG: polymerase small subunit [Euryarchaeota archaeon]|nr:polymerase small subunit [Euryarchaeota archaeon]